MPPQIETADELIDALPLDKPIYARTPHGSYWFLVESVEEVERDGEDVAVLVLREVQP